MLFTLALPLLLFISAVITFSACTLSFARKIPYKKFLNAVISCIGLLTYVAFDNYVILTQEEAHIPIDWEEKFPALILLATSIILQFTLPAIFRHSLTIALPDHNGAASDTIKATIKLHKFVVGFCVFYLLCRLAFWQF